MEGGSSHNNLLLVLPVPQAYLHYCDFGPEVLFAENSVSTDLCMAGPFLLFDSNGNAQRAAIP